MNSRKIQRAQRRRKDSKGRNKPKGELTVPPEILKVKELERERERTKSAQNKKDRGAGLHVSESKDEATVITLPNEHAQKGSFTTQTKQSAMRDEVELSLTSDYSKGKEEEKDGLEVSINMSESISVSQNELSRSESLDSCDASTSIDTSLGSSLEGRDPTLKQEVRPEHGRILKQPVVVSSTPTDVGIDTQILPVTQKVLQPLQFETEEKAVRSTVQEKDSLQAVKESTEGLLGANELHPVSPAKTEATMHTQTTDASTLTEATFDGDSGIMSPYTVESDLAYSSLFSGLSEGNEPARYAISPAPKEVVGLPATKTGLVSQWRSRMNLQSRVPTMLSEIQFDSYIPELVKNLPLMNSVEENGSTQKKETILWTKFESYQNGLYLLVGYTDGFHIWDVSDDYKVTEVLSLRSGWAARIVHFLIEGQIDKSEESHPLDAARPLVAIVSKVDEESGKEADSFIVHCFSLTFQRYAHEIRFDSKVLGIQSNEKYALIALKESIFAFDSRSLEHRFAVNCYPCPGLSAAFSLGDRWLAFSGTEEKVRDEYTTEKSSASESFGWREVSKDLVSGVYSLNKFVHNIHKVEHLEQVTPNAGVIVVYDLKTKSPLAVWKGHSEPIETMAFNANGALLATAPCGGQTIHVYRIQPLSTPQYALLYKLERGLTITSIRQIAFSPDMRWIGVTSSSGTCHLFAVSYTGGIPDAYSHPAMILDATPKITSSSVVDRSQNPLVGIRKKVVDVVSKSLPVSTLTKQMQSKLSSVEAKVYVSSKPLRVKRQEREVCLDSIARVRQRVMHDASSEDCVPYPVEVAFAGEKLRVMSATGVLEEYELIPFIVSNDRENLQLSVNPKLCWDLCRRDDWPGIFNSVSSSDAQESNLDWRNKSFDAIRGKWLSNTEIKSHHAPIIPLWASPQFRFLTYTETDEELPIFVESLEGKVVEVRGAGPAPIDPKSGRAVRRSMSDMYMTQEVKHAIDTPTRFQNLHMPSEKEAVESILVYDENESPSSQHDEMVREEGSHEEFDYHVDEIFIQDEELYGDAVLDEMKRRKQHKIKEN